MDQDQNDEYDDLGRLAHGVAGGVLLAVIIALVAAQLAGILPPSAGRNLAILTVAAALLWQGWA